MAVLKFSTSPSIKGALRVMNRTVMAVDVIMTESFVEKRGLNSVFSRSSFVPVGLEDPDECSSAK